jgi:hypothetical protein
MNYLGDYSEDSMIDIFFTTHSKEGGALAPSSAFEADDIRIYKNNSASQKTTTNGLTMTSPFDSVVGLHQLRIDTSNDTGDAGFWEDGNEYIVILIPDETVDGESVVKVIASFSIERSNGSLDYIKSVDTQVGITDGKVDTIDGVVDAILVDTGTTLDGKIDVIDGIVDAILVDTGTTLDSKINTIDSIVDDILVDTGTTIPGLIAALPTVDLIHDEVVEGTITLRQAIRLLIAYVCGKANGGGTSTLNYRDQADALNRITLTVDASGNRSAVTLNVT